MATTLAALLRGWALDDGGVPLFDPATLEEPLQSVPVGDRPGFLHIAGQVPPHAVLHVPLSLDPGRSRIVLRRLGGNEVLGDIGICMVQPSPHLVIGLGGSRVRIATGRSAAFHGEVSAWHDTALLVGDGATSNGVRIVLDRSTVVIGRDALISDEVLVQSQDQHGVVDLDSLALVNPPRARTLVGEHVWLGRRCTLMPDVAIGAGSIVGAGAVVTRDVPAFCAAAGVPARVVRERTSWTRSPHAPSGAERAWLETQRALRRAE